PGLVLPARYAEAVPDCRGTSLPAVKYTAPGFNRAVDSASCAPRVLPPPAFVGSPKQRAAAPRLCDGVGLPADPVRPAEHRRPAVEERSGRALRGRLAVLRLRKTLRRAP